MPPAKKRRFQSETSCSVHKKSISGTEDDQIDYSKLIGTPQQANGSVQLWQSRLRDSPSKNNIVGESTSEKYERLEALRSRKNVFKKLRSTKVRNNELKSAMARQRDRINQLERSLANERESFGLLQKEINPVCKSARKLKHLLNSNEEERIEQNSENILESPTTSDNNLRKSVHFDENRSNLDNIERNPTPLKFDEHEEQNIALADIYTSDNELGFKMPEKRPNSAPKIRKSKSGKSSVQKIGKGIEKMRVSSLLSDSKDKSLPEWAVEGVVELFQRLDGSNKGYLSPKDMNLLVVLSKDTSGIKFSNLSLRQLCTDENLDWNSVHGGLTLLGLVQYYRNRGLQKLLRDLEHAKIPFDARPIVSQKNTLEDAHDQLIDAQRLVTHLRDRVSILEAENAKGDAEKQRFKALLQETHNTIAFKDTEVQDQKLMIQRLQAQLNDNNSEKETLEHGIFSTQSDLARSQSEVAELQELLNRQISEKETLQRQLWALQRGQERLQDATASATSTLWRSQEALKEEQRKSRLMYRQLVDQRFRDSAVSSSAAKKTRKSQRM
eukprot:TRINITY_DN986_c0_g1_i1.p1 TRINITY_DN986_c0_g1~~TRINITY_DN986_c0_g1_i1.p1  ORF type:complete len:555 (+),score=169.35 TRINITY_DN986_c0_g1_i1:106-1770(+)